MSVFAALVVLGSTAQAQHRPHRHHAERIDPRYARMRSRWHRAPSSSERAAWEATTPRPPLVLRPIAQGEPVTLTPDRDDGGFGADDLALARTALRDRRSGGVHEIDPLLLDRIYRAMRHFRAPWAWVVSGYRANAGTSRHASGRAMDVVLPGVGDALVATVPRSEGFTGVGVYPRSGFVHVDVRNRSYFWVDSSPPGAPNRTREVRSAEAARADESARRRGLSPPVANESTDTAAREEPEEPTTDDEETIDDEAPDAGERDR